MTRDLMELEAWNPDAIDARQRKLAQYAFGIWHFSGEPPPLDEEGGTPQDENEGEDTDSDVLAQLPEMPTG